LAAETHTAGPWTPDQRAIGLRWWIDQRTVLRLWAGASGPPGSVTIVERSTNIVSAGMDEIAVQQLLEVIADFDESGGASSGWSRGSCPSRNSGSLTLGSRRKADGLLRPAARDRVHDGQLWRLTAGGWAARNRRA
jgi:hypothetical protein